LRPRERPAIGIAVMGALVATQVDTVPGAPRYVGQFVEGYHLAVHTGAAILLGGAVLAMLTVRKIRHPEFVAQPETLAA
jgi:hypothetical protein